MKREVTGVTEGLAIWDKTTLREKKSVGKENLESVLTCSNHIYPPVFPAKICVCGIAEPPCTPPTVQVMAQYARCTLTGDTQTIPCRLSCRGSL